MSGAGFRPVCCPCCGTEERSCWKEGRPATSCCAARTLKRVMQALKPLSVCARCKNAFGSGPESPQPSLCVRCLNDGWEVHIERTGVLAGPHRVTRNTGGTDE